jgi:uncharacterized protein (TIGR00251 family)
VSIGSIWRWAGADLELSIHAQPGARRTEVQGIHGDALKIRVQARPVKGAANEALLEFLAEALQVPRQRCVLISGETSRHKRVRIEGPDRAVAEARLRRWGLQTSS